MSNKYISTITRIGLILSLFFICETGFSQQFFGQFYKTEHVHDETCGAVLFDKWIEENYGTELNKEVFESWMKDRLEKRKSDPVMMRRRDEVRVIPVVVHVIHSGTEVGQGPNIPMEQIEAQIKTLNEDFRRLNADTVNTPEEFRDIAADSGIEFVLAKQDPRGRPTDGVVRVQGPRNVYGFEDIFTIGQVSIWPPEEYFNIWVLNFRGTLRGVGSPPVSSLPGWGNTVFPREANGIWVDYRWFGSGGNADPSSLGRTATHEVGHYLSLRHIWGDGGCSATDFVDDTPDQDGSNNFVCRVGQPRITCGTRDLTENYMDYSGDECYNLFTEGQVDRFDVVLTESPFRASLVNGRATIAPELFANDLGMERLIEPQNLLCNLDFSPQLIVFNAGTNQVTSTRIELRNNGVLIQTKDFNLDLGSFEEETLTFDPISLPPGNNDFEARIVLTNNVQDGNEFNNVLTSNPVIQPEIGLPYALQFEDINQTWVVDNPDDSFTWEETTLTLDGIQTQSLVVKNFSYDSEGQQDFLISPRIDLTNLENAQVSFMMAYAPNTRAEREDVLIVAVSTDCGNNFEIINSNFIKEDFLLQTSDPINSEFIPTSSAQFRREILDLSPYAGNNNVRIAFINQTGNNNNLYIKDIEILDEEVFRYDIQIVEFTSPSPITTDAFTEERFIIKNTGNLPITGFLFRRQTTGGAPQLFIFRGELFPDEDFEIELPKSTSVGFNRLNYEIFFPSFDTNPREAIQKDLFLNIDGSRIQSPWRQGFNSIQTLDPWLTINPERNLNSWSILSVQTGRPGDNVLVLEPKEGQNSFWLGSPVFDMSRSPQGAILFDLAAGQVGPGTVFKIMGSENGGVSYDEIWRLSGNEISTTSGPTVNPNTQSDFRTEFVDISTLAGTNKSNGRLAFVLESSGLEDSPIYLNNFEFFLSADSEPVRPRLGTAVVFPNPAREFFNIAFNLNSFETVNIQIVNANGMVVHEVDYPNTLNQTYTFSSSNFSKGLFIIKINSRTLSETSKLFIH